MQLTPVIQKFILHWGEMGTKWGINRTIAQIQALLYVAPEALSAEEISETLNVARSNVSNSLKELLNWRIIKIEPLLGERKDHFKSIEDPWELFKIIMIERKRREIDPALEVLRECLKEATEKTPLEKHSKKKLKELHDFMEISTAWFEQLSSLPVKSLTKFFKFGHKMKKIFKIG